MRERSQFYFLIASEGEGESPASQQPTKQPTLYHPSLYIKIPLERQRTNGRRATPVFMWAHFFPKAHFTIIFIQFGAPILSPVAHPTPTHPRRRRCNTPIPLREAHATKDIEQVDCRFFVDPVLGGGERVSLQTKLWTRI